MARSLNRRFEITGQIVALGPVHVGGGRDNPETDMPLAIDGQNRLYIPGTGMTGPLRAWVADHYDEDVAKRLFGYQCRDKGDASIVIVEDALVHPDSPAPEVWDGVGIDREYGTAATQIKFDRAILPAGTRLELRIVVEFKGTPCDPHGRAVLGHMLRALANAEIAFGGGTTRGQGQVQLASDSLRVVEQDWSTRAGVLAFLRGGGTAYSGAKAIEHLIGTVDDAGPRSPDQLDVTITWRPVGPLMSKAAEDGDAVDIVPFTSAVNGEHVALALPGSGLKGALRERAERIVRTALARDPESKWRGLHPRARHRAQVNEPLVRLLFGLARKGTDQDGSVSQNLEGCIGAINVGTCYAADTMASKAWRKIVGAVADTSERTRKGASPLYAAIHSADRENSWCYPGSKTARRLEQAYHVAIDRWLGGAAEHFLYSAIEPWDLAWNSIQLSVDIARLRANAELHGSKQLEMEVEAAVCLLLVLLRDLAAGRIPVGFGANRGYGSLAVENVYIQASGPTVAWLGEANLPAGDLGSLPAEILDRLQSSWDRWIATNGEQNVAA